MIGNPLFSSTCPKEQQKISPSIQADLKYDWWEREIEKINYNHHLMTSASIMTSKTLIISAKTPEHFTFDLSISLHQKTSSEKHPPNTLSYIN